MCQNHYKTVTGVEQYSQMQHKKVVAGSTEKNLSGKSHVY